MVTSTVPADALAIDVVDVRKRFGGIAALKGISLRVAPGTVHAVVGENGAGKSTLGKIIAGVYLPDAGRLEIDGVAVRFSSPRDARDTGVARVAQEPTLVPRRSVIENVFLGVEPTSLGFTRNTSLRQRYEELAGDLGHLIDARTLVGSLRLADQQKVEVMRAVARNARAIVFDEPTASLSVDEAALLFETIRRLQSRGTTIVYVSHFLDEVLALADQVTVLRDGELVRTSVTEEETPQSLIQAMLGRPLERLFPDRGQQSIGRPMLMVEGLSRPGAFTDVSFTVHVGEIVGLAGLVGSGRSEVARAIFAADRAQGGSIEVDGRKAGFRRPADAIRAGVALVPEDRGHQGLLMKRSVLENIWLANLGQVSSHGFVRPAASRRLAGDLVKVLNIRTPGLAAPVGTLSGGNQQKVLFAKWLSRAPKVLIADEPTRGVDVGAKNAIYELLRAVAARGTAVLMISSEIEEIVGLSDRVFVMRAGRIAAELERAQVTEEAIMAAAFSPTALSA